MAAWMVDLPWEIRHCAEVGMGCLLSRAPTTISALRSRRRLVTSRRLRRYKLYTQIAEKLSGSIAYPSSRLSAMRPTLGFARHSLFRWLAFSVRLDTLETPAVACDER